jgi:SEC-C motif domain protein
MECPCGSGLAYADCCEPIITGTRPALTAEALMRARYSAYARTEIDFLLSSLHPSSRDGHDDKGIRDWSENSRWLGLKILATEAGGEQDDAGTVEFAATYAYGEEGKPRRHHELAEFVREDGVWTFVNGAPVKEKPVVREEPKVGRNDPCACGSGKKYKKCCGQS